MEERGKPWGINFSYDGPIRNTYNSHRFVEKAYDVGGEKVQRKFIEKIFAGYFEQEQDIGDADFLAKSAVDAGVFADIDAVGDLRLILHSIV
jgi:predicted DsbA family dithiol-disulfide isomerase